MQNPIFSAFTILVTTSLLSRAATPLLTDLPLQKTISVHGITWTLSRDVRVGRFVNNDFYVVGACTVTAITPAPTASPARNGSVLNIPPGDQGTGFDDRSSNYRPAIRKYPPIALKPTDALVSTISMADSAMPKVRAWLSPNPGTESSCKTAAVLTCLAAPVATDAFRPSYCDRGQRLYYADSIRWNLLPNLKRVAGMTPAALHEWSWHFINSPWLDVCFFGFDAPLDYMTHYSAETGRAVGMATLFLICDFSQVQKDSLMKGLLQYGIDLWGTVRGCNATRGWEAHGGHGSGRKWPLIFTGLMLGDTAMAKPTLTYPTLRIGEDMQTAWGYCWATGDSNYVYTGHQGLWNGQPVSTKPGWGPYEGTPPSQWYCCESGYTMPLGEAYRRCCTSHAWIAEALGARLMHALNLWNHPAFFGYTDRWMTASHADSAAIIAIKVARGWDFSASWQRQGESWDDITNQMWKAYRYSSAAIKPLSSRPAALKATLTISQSSEIHGVRIDYSVPAAGPVALAVYDLAGRRVTLLFDGQVNAGMHSIMWNVSTNRGCPVGPGCYRVVAHFNGSLRIAKLTMVE
jgi:hypothetical protein